MAAPPKAATPGGASGSKMWLLGMVSGLIAVMAAPVAALLAVLMLPLGIVWFADRSDGRAMPRIVLVAGLATLIGPLQRLWMSDLSWSAALGLLGDLPLVAGAWAAQGGAWLLGELAPLVVRLVLDIMAAGQAAGLRAERAKLQEEWGPPDAS